MFKDGYIIWEKSIQSSSKLYVPMSSISSKTTVWNSTIGIPRLSWLIELCEAKENKIAPPINMATKDPTAMF